MFTVLRFIPFFLFPRIFSNGCAWQVHVSFVLFNASFINKSSIVAFNDIGKSAKDLLTKDYPVGGVKLEIKTTTSDGVVTYIVFQDTCHP